MATNSQKLQYVNNQTWKIYYPSYVEFIDKGGDPVYYLNIDSDINFFMVKGFMNIEKVKFVDCNDVKVEMEWEDDQYKNILKVYPNQELTITCVNHYYSDNRISYTTFRPLKDGLLVSQYVRLDDVWDETTEYEISVSDYDERHHLLMKVFDTILETHRGLLKL
ncbi:hypothetical protein phiOC_p302 [Ochrobactrum phage vB_OspM_OC]|nr:hypothetical protein phiOC_p302 [Ochrobactrum phage vB_OspM_OC]